MSNKTPNPLVAAIKVSEDFQNILHGLDAHLEELTGQKVGFALVVFTEPRSSYGSNCDRAEVAHELETLLQYWKEGMPDIPTHKILTQSGREH